MNHNKKISIFILTRKRPEHLKGLLTSIENNVYDVNNLEIWMGIDSDDEITKSFIEDFAPKSKLHIRFWVNNKKSSVCIGCEENYVNRHNDLLFPMTERSTGDFLWILNDDVQVFTQDFDKILIEQIEENLLETPDRILYAKVDEIFRWGKANRCGSLRVAEKYACYPIISRELYEALGWFIPLSLPANGADIALAEIMGRCIYDRFRQFLDVHIYDQILESPVKEKPHFGPESLGHEESKAAVERIEHYIAEHEGVATPIEPYGIEISFIYTCKWCSHDMLVNVSLPTSNVITCSRCQTPHFIADSTSFPPEFHQSVDEMKGFLSAFQNHMSKFGFNQENSETYNLTPSVPCGVKKEGDLFDDVSLEELALRNLDTKNIPTESKK